MGLEIEHKWLPKPELITKVKNVSKPVKIVQAYLCREPVIRVRREGEKYYLTYKGKGLLVREEYNLPLTKEAFDKLLEKCEGNRITKDRYTVPFETLYPDRTGSRNESEEKRMLELDLFHEQLEGLVILEMEFGSEKEAETFSAPDEFGKDVTGDPKYTNAELSR